MFSINFFASLHLLLCRITSSVKWCHAYLCIFPLASVCCYWCVISDHLLMCKCVPVGPRCSGRRCRPWLSDSTCGWLLQPGDPYQSHSPCSRHWLLGGTRGHCQPMKINCHQPPSLTIRHCEASVLPTCHPLWTHSTSCLMGRSGKWGSASLLPRMLCGCGGHRKWHTTPWSWCWPMRGSRTSSQLQTRLDSTGHKVM